jgi:hypothetical protein
MRQKQREKARANRAESKEAKKPKTTSAERIRRLRERRKADTSDVASEPGVASISRAAQAMDIDTDSEQSTQIQTENEDETPDTSQRGYVGHHESSELQQPASVSDHSMCLVLPENYRILWERATGHFRCMFTENEYGHKCYVCDRLWFLRDLKVATAAMAAYLVEYFPGENTAQFKLCNNCYKVCETNNIPPMGRSNGSAYPPKPTHLQKLDSLTERLISLRIPYMCIYTVYAAKAATESWDKSLTCPLMSIQWYGACHDPWTTTTPSMSN